MALVNWDPFSELNSLHAQVNSLFNEAFGSIGSPVAAPATDVYSSDNELSIEASLPGFKDSEVTVQQHEGDLEIKAEHQEKEEKKGRKYMLHESASRYYRRFSLPKNADGDHIDARFKDGVLKVTIPFKELPQPKRVAIKAQNK